MKTVTIDSAELRTALSLAVGSLSGLDSLPPAYGYVLLRSAVASLSLTTHGRHYSVTAEVPAICADEPLETCVNAKHLHGLIGSMNELVTMTQHKGGLQVAGANSVHYLRVLSPDQFPLSSEAVTGHQASISGSLLSSMLTCAMSAAETNRFGEQRWQALEWIAKDGRLSITGCCGPFLINTEIPLEGEFYALTSLKTAEVIETLAKRSETINIAVSRSVLTASSSVGSISIQLLSTPWPDWRMLIGEQYAHTVEMDALTTLPALKRAMLSCRLYEDKIDPRVAIRLAADKAMLLCQGQGESRERLAIKGNSNVNLALDGQRLATFLGLVKGVTVWQIDNNRPIRFTPKQQGEFTMQCLLMPLADV